MIEAPETTAALEAEIQAILDTTAGAVAEWNLRLGEDWSGDPGVFITVTFKDSELQRIWPSHRGLESALDIAAIRRFPSRLSYVTFTAQTDAADPTPALRQRRRR